MYDQTSPVALVTGAAHGIGEGIAERLARDGHDVALLDIDQERCGPVADRIARKFSVATMAVIADTGNEQDVRGALAQVAERFGRLTAVVNNAGNPHPSTVPVDELERAEWDRYLQTNLTGYFLIAKHSIKLLRESHGAMVNVSSIHALQSDSGHNMAYAASKGGIVAFTHALALSEGQKVRVNCISPGWIDVRGEEDRERSPLRGIDHEQHPAGRVGRPHDIAAVTAFLLSEDAAFITGQNIVVDGGMVRKLAYLS